MKTFSATHLNKHAQEVFEEAKESGSVMIEHNNYRKGMFAITYKPTIYVHGESTVESEGDGFERVNKDAC